MFCNHAPAPQGTPDENITAVWDKVRTYSTEMGIKDGYRNMHIGMFCMRSRPNFKFPKLKGRAVEVKNLGPPLLKAWIDYMDHGSTVHRQVRLLLQCNVRMEEILSDNKDRNKLPVAEHTKLMKECESFLVLSTAVAHHYNGIGIKAFNIVPKHHLLWHACQQSRFLNTRMTWCFSGEDFMQHVRRLGQSVIRGTPANMLSKKMARKWVRGYTMRLLRRTR